MGHAIGLVHEQSRVDRDDYVKINSQNIWPGRAGNFQKYSTTQIDNRSVTYDFTSVMHYKPKVRITADKKIIIHFTRLEVLITPMTFPFASFA